MDEVFLLLFVHKKKSSPCLASWDCHRRPGGRLCRGNAQGRGFIGTPAGDHVIPGGDRRRGIGVAARQGERAARGEAAAWGRREHGWGGAVDRHEFAGLPVDVGEGVGEAHGVRVERAFEHFAHAAGFDDDAGVHHGDAVAGIGDDGHVVSDQDHGEAEAGLEFADDVEHLALDDDVQRGDGFVGDDQGRVEGEGQSNRGALAHAAGELVRVVGQADRVEADEAEEFFGAGLGGGAGEAAAFDQDFEHLGAQALDRVERVHRGLRHEGQAAPADLALLGFGEGDEVGAFEDDFSAGDTAGIGQDAHDGAAHGGFAAAGFADQAEDGAGLDGEAGAVDGTGDAGAGAVMDLEIFDGKEAHLSASLGNRSFSEPREIMKPARTMDMMAKPGGANQFHAPRPSAWLA